MSITSAPRITFAIPFYSTPEFLDSAIRSVLAQSIQNWQLIVVDDRSPAPGIRSLVEGFDDPRIQYNLNEKNMGQSGNFNRCLELAQTELVTLLHADDQLLPNYAELILKAADQYKECWALFCNAEIIDENARKVFSFADYYKRFIIPSNSSTFILEGEAGLRRLIPGNFIMAPTLCFRKEKIGEIRFSAEWKCAPDLDLTSRLLIVGGSLVGIPEVAFQYRRHCASGTAEFRKSLKQFDEEVRLYNHIASQAEAIGWMNATREARAMRIVKLRLAYFGLKDLVLLSPLQSFNKFLLALKLIFTPQRERPASS